MMPLVQLHEIDAANAAKKTIVQKAHWHLNRAQHSDEGVMDMQRTLQRLEACRSTVCRRTKTWVGERGRGRSPGNRELAHGVREYSHAYIGEAWPNTLAGNNIYAVLFAGVVSTVEQS